MGANASLVLTTIHDPAVLEKYFENFLRYGRLDSVRVFLIPDRKTPSAAYERCETLRARGFRVSCPTLEEQEEFLRKVAFPAHLVPYDSDNRRNVGYLMALASGDDFVISIDDDNYCRAEEDFFDAHAVVCSNQVSATIVDSTDSWFNICTQLVLDRPGSTYPRGFPYYARHKTRQTSQRTNTVPVHMNAGLWLLDPDVDAISWLVAPAHSTSFSGHSVVLGEQTWSPVNTQNTAMRRDVVPAYYFVRMGYPLAGVPIDRFGDIFSGYFAQACIRCVGGYIRVGNPVVEHRRNSHNYMQDAFNEWACILVLEDLLPWLTDCKALDGSSYCDAYLTLSHALEDVVARFKGRIWSDATRGYFHQMAYCMRSWVRACRTIG